MFWRSVTAALACPTTLTATSPVRGTGTTRSNAFRAASRSPPAISWTGSGSPWPVGPGVPSLWETSGDSGTSFRLLAVVMGTSPELDWPR
ncbi:hypothetical protein EDD17DRAFT_1583214 [Pisolithus thermaeus]|nr:hypothetical protein EDD17DRAFT_1583214 [Pisolithus thermaeus]